jgi:predicted ATPase
VGGREQVGLREKWLYFSYLLPAIAPSEIFVGRETEVTQIHQWFTKALQGERQIGFIAGEPGIGKTALVASSVAHLAATEYVWVGHGQCIDHYGAGEAYLPILEALGRLCREAEADNLVTLLRQYAPCWLVQMPALLSPAERETLGRSLSGVTQARMLRELAETLEVLTASRLLVLVVEDLHWSDPSTLAFLTYAARRRDRARLLVLGTYRPVEVLRHAYPLRRVIAELRQHRQCVDITLTSLPEAAITAYVRARFEARAVSEGLVRLRSAYTEAIAHLTQSLTLLKTLPHTLEQAQHELTLTLALGGPLAVTKGYAAPEVAQVYTWARELYHQLGATGERSPVAWRLWQFYLVRGELQPAWELGEECLSLAGDDTTALLVAHYALALCLFYLGEFAPTRLHAEQGTALYDARHHHVLASLYGYDLGMACLSYAALALWMLGYPDQAQQRCEAALTLARQLSHPFSVAFGLGHKAVLHQFRREGRAACESAQELIMFCTERGFSQWVDMGTILHGWGLAAQGQGEMGIAQMRQGLSSSQSAGTKLGQAPVLAQLAEVYWRTGQTAVGLQALTEALAVIDTTGERWWAAETYRLKGELLLQQGVQEASAVAMCFRHAMDIARQQHARSLELRAATSLARLWQSQGKGTAAGELLAPVYGWFTEGLDTPDLQEAKAVLAEVGISM